MFIDDWIARISRIMKYKCTGDGKLIANFMQPSDEIQFFWAFGGLRPLKRNGEEKHSYLRGRRNWSGKLQTQFLESL